MSDELFELWEEARQYGRVRLCTTEDGLYYAFIEFNSIKHTKLQAKSSFDCKTPHEALQMSIFVAEKIVEEFSSLQKRIEND